MAPTIHNPHDGLTIARDEWRRICNLHPQLTTTFELTVNKRLSRVLARCCYPWLGERGRIEMSSTILQSTEYHIRQIVIHEAAHALTRGAGHGPTWVAKARELGYDGGRLFTDSESLPAPALVAQCGACGYHYFRRRRRRKIARCWCGQMALRFVPNTDQLRPSNTKHPARGHGLPDNSSQWRGPVECLSWGLANPEAIGQSRVTAAASNATNTPNATIQELLDELRTGPDKRRQQQIRRRLRTLGHQGGLRG